VLSHLAAGALMPSHGVARLYADRFLSGGAMAAGLVAFAITLIRANLTLRNVVG